MVGLEVDTRPGVAQMPSTRILRPLRLLGAVFAIVLISGVSFADELNKGGPAPNF